ncbi:hypothetical protein GTZ99_08180 [Novosphingobium sp. FSY-8]|uniref:Uncharacterized protein n=1 Tax=Novosphingobium ovatum TaxID=1908523 RepID=A0ABW9XDG6_9SPHN|nr:hypothetical protein [Novosphingobium ovatum]NBC36532.1 hypothetical protein [Novosphingobium ovatum]
MFGFLMCLLSKHSPNRRKVWVGKEGRYLGRCHRCGAAIKRLDRENWVRDWSRLFSNDREARKRQKTDNTD